MKASEREQLRHNEIADALDRASGFYTQNRGRTLSIVAAVVVVAVLVVGVFAWRQRANTQASTALAEAMIVSESAIQPPAPPAGAPADQPATPVQAPHTFPTVQARAEAALPKLLSVADTYANHDAGVTARFQAAGTLLQLGRFDEAIAQYDRVIGSGSGLLATSARLGKAEAELRSGKNDAAIATFKELAEKPNGDMPAEALLMELARAYTVAGKPDDARKTLTQVVEQHADTPAAAQAKQELEKLPG